MNLLIPRRHFDPTVLEMMDRPQADPRILRDDLKNLRTINKYFGGLRAVQKSVVPLIDKILPRQTVSLLDLATGSADHPIALVHLARRMKRTIHITASDRNPAMLAMAKERTAAFSEITVEECDVLSPKFTDKSFDVVICSLALHHFSFDDAILIVRNMKRLSRVGFIINDLNRTWVAASTAWLYTHLTSRNRMTLFDSHISVLRAFTPGELRTIAEKANVQNFSISQHPFFRLVLVAEHEILHR